MIHSDFTDLEAWRKAFLPGDLPTQEQAAAMYRDGIGRRTCPDCGTVYDGKSWIACPFCGDLA